MVLGLPCWFFRLISGVGQGEGRSWGILCSSRSFSVYLSLWGVVSAVRIGRIFRESVHNYIVKRDAKPVYRFGASIPADYAVKCSRIHLQCQPNFSEKFCWSVANDSCRGRSPSYGALQPAIARQEIEEREGGETQF